LGGGGRAGCAECVALLRAAGAKVEGEEKEAEAANYTGKPDALYKLCESSSTPPTAKVDELIATGINLRYQGDYKWTALMCASDYGHATAVEAIVAADPDPDHIWMTETKYGQTALILAAQCGNHRIVDILIKADPSVDHLNMKDSGGDTALASSIKHDGQGRAGCAECVALLRAAGTKVEGEEKEDVAAVAELAEAEIAKLAKAADVERALLLKAVDDAHASVRQDDHDEGGGESKGSGGDSDESGFEAYCLADTPGPHPLAYLRRWWFMVGCGENGTAYPGGSDAEQTALWNTKTVNTVKDDMAQFRANADAGHDDYAAKSGSHMFDFANGGKATLKAGVDNTVSFTYPHGAVEANSGECPWIGIYLHGTTDLVGENMWYQCRVNRANGFSWAAEFIPEQPGTYTVTMVPHGGSADAPLSTLELKVSPGE
jgi:hypothetical protein